MTACASAVFAANPVITKHDAQLMEKDVHINLTWQSDEPIVKIIATAGKEQIIITDNIENLRNERGYSGEIDIIVPAYIYNSTNERTLYMSQQSSNPVHQSSSEVYSNYISPQNEAVQYTVQIVDDFNQRSTLLKEKVRRIEPNQQFSEQKPVQKSTNTATVDTKDPLNSVLDTAVGLAGKIGQNPVIKNVKVKTWTENRVSISFEATCTKGLNNVAFEVRDSRGDIANQGTISCDSAKSCTKQSDPFTLTQGKYTVSLVATDIENNKSKTIEQEFLFTGDTSSTQQNNQQNTQQTTNTGNQETGSRSSTSDSTGVTYGPQ